jgi:hypothetical protein
MRLAWEGSLLSSDLTWSDNVVQIAWPSDRDWWQLWTPASDAERRRATPSDAERCQAWGKAGKGPRKNGIDTSMIDALHVCGSIRMSRRLGTFELWQIEPSIAMKISLPGLYVQYKNSNQFSIISIVAIILSGCENGLIVRYLSSIHTNLHRPKDRTYRHKR